MKQSSNYNVLVLTPAPAAMILEQMY